VTTPRRELNPEQRAIVEAPLGCPLKVVAGAGTGKTETLKSRFVYLVTALGMDAARVLAVTFTNKAAAEMRERIEAALRDAGQDPPPDLYIHTFHSLCARLLHDHCYEAQLPPDHTLLDEIGQQERLDGFFDRVLAGEFERVADLAMANILSVGVDDLGVVRETVKSAIGMAKTHGLRPAELRDRLLDQSARFFASLPTAEEVLGLTGRQDIPGLVVSRLKQSGFDVGLPADRAVLNSVQKIYYADLRGKGRPHDDTDQVAGTQADCERVMARLCAAAYAQYQRELHGAGMLDFDDLILRTVGLLRRNDRVRRHYRDLFEYVLVDEFQDTSPVQMDLIRLLARSEPCTLDCARPGGCDGRRLTNVLVVGDRKQSIYAFRNARRDNIDLLIPCDDEAVRRSLVRNYRSGPAIIDLANGVAADVEPGDPPLITESAVDALVLRGPDFGAIEDKKVPVAEARAAESTYIAEGIQSLVRGEEGPGDIGYGDIAVLVRTGKGFAALKDAFDERSIPYVSLGGLGFFEEPMVRDVLGLLHVIENPFDSLSLARVLLRPPYLLTDRQLYLVGSEPGVVLDDEEAAGRRSRPLFDTLADVVLSSDGGGRSPEERAELPLGKLRDLAGRVIELRARRHAMTAREAFEAVVDRDVFLQGRLASELATWPRSRLLFERVLDQLEAVDERRLRDLTDRLSYYERGGGSDLPAPDDETVGDAVRVLTIHRAKGLEFRVVFLPVQRMRSRGDRYWRIDPKWGLIPGKILGRESVKRVLYKALAPRQDEDAAEERRLHYVAVTRPREMLITTSSAEEHPYGGYFERAEREESCPLPAEPARGDPIPVHAPLPRRVLQREVELPAPRVLTASFTALSELAECPVRYFIRRRWGLDMPTDDDTVEDGGSAIGRAFHTAVARHYLGPVEPRARRQMLRAELDAAGGLMARDLPRLTALFDAFLGSEWAALKPPADHVERPFRWFTASPSGTYVALSGYIDLIHEDGHGVHVLDLKTHRELTPEKAEQQYALQLHIYEEALKSEGFATPAACSLLHVTEAGVTLLPMSDAGSAPTRDRLSGLLEQLVEVSAMRRIPSRPESAPCDRCTFGTLCPYSDPSPSPPGRGPG